MAAPGDERPVMPRGSQQLDWEVPRDFRPQASVAGKEAAYSDKPPSRSFRTTITEVLDKVLPPHGHYLGLRRWFFLGALAAVVILVVLVIGLSVGLTRRSGYVPYCAT